MRSSPQLTPDGVSLRHYLPFYAVGLGSIISTLPADDRKEVKRILNLYVTQRIAAVQAVQAGITGDHELQTQAKELQNGLWLTGVRIAQRDPTPTTALFLQSLNEVIDMHTKRITVGLYHRMPSVFG